MRWSSSCSFRGGNAAARQFDRREEDLGRVVHANLERTGRIVVEPRRDRAVGERVERCPRACRPRGFVSARLVPGPARRGGAGAPAPRCSRVARPRWNRGRAGAARSPGTRRGTGCVATSMPLPMSSQSLRTSIGTGVASSASASSSIALQTFEHLLGDRLEQRSASCRSS